MGFDGCNAMMIFAHPDDAELLSFGLMRRIFLSGGNIDVLIVSDGSSGIAVGESALDQLPLVRMQETRNALRNIARDVTTLALPDGKITPDGDTVRVIEAAIVDKRPDLVVTHHLDGTGTDHQDHRAVASAVRNICFRKPFVTTILSVEPLQPFTDFKPTCFVDITDHLDEKCEALKHHVSQAGRAYLDKAFHSARGLRWSSLVATKPSHDDRVFETYAIEKTVW
ncbi:MAG: PIG-L family deacetylase [Litoreibacter sp.]|uniref:PIG-L deacetylase family protein n=1 Tax=Litoreibacter sp. TaxID=1969459 RepID=UPI003298C30A